MNPDNVIALLAGGFCVLAVVDVILFIKNRRLRAMNDRQASVIESGHRIRKDVSPAPAQRPEPPPARVVREDRNVPKPTIGGRTRFVSGDGGQWDARPRVEVDDKPGYSS